MKKKFISILTTVVMIITLVAVCFPNEAFFWLSITADAINTRNYGDLTYAIYSGEIGDYVEIIGCNSSATEIEIPSEINGVPVTHIGDKAFSAVLNLKSVIIPDSVTTVGCAVFYDCTALEEIILSKNITALPSFYDETKNNYIGFFEECNSLKTISIPQGVTSIESSAFYSCDSLLSIVIPNSVVSIGAYAFENCKMLKSISIPNSVKEIGTEAFCRCSTLKSVNIPSGIKIIEKNVFNSCLALTDIEIPNGINTINEKAFFNCSSLKSIIIPESVSSVMYRAFYGCSSLESITIKNSNCRLYQILSNSSNVIFRGYTASTARDYANENSYEFEALGDLRCDGYIIKNYGDLLYKEYSDHIEISDCYTYAEKVIIPNEINNIPVTAIGESAFFNCINLMEITIPDSVTFIGSAAFLGTGWLDNQPDGLVYAGNFAYTYKGDMPENTEINLKNGTIGIVERSFEGYDSLISITLPDTVINIGEFAFSNCSNLTSLIIPDSVISIGNCAFSGCTGLTSVNIPDSVKFVGYDAFDCKISVSDNTTVADDAHILRPYETPSNFYSMCGKIIRTYVNEIENDVFEVVKSNSNSVVVVDQFNQDRLITKHYISYELPRFGGVFYGKKNNFIIFTQSNPNEDDSCEVFRVVKYTKNWKRVSCCSIYGNEGVVNPIDGGSLRMAELDDNLYIHTCNICYKANDGINHQSNLSFVLNQETMEYTSTIHNFVSHSMNQFVRTDETDVYYIDVGDSAPRCVVLQTLSHNRRQCVLPIQGISGDNHTGVTIGGFELSENNCLVAGHSVKQYNPDTYNYDGKRNVFLSVTPKNFKTEDDVTTENIWITKFTDDDNIYPYGTTLLKKDENTFYIMWQEYNMVEETSIGKLVKIDENGKYLSEIVNLPNGIQFSDGQPIITSDGAIAWPIVEESGAETVITKIYPENILFCLQGDVNIDGDFNIADLVMLQKWLLGSGGLTYWQAGDYDNNGIIDVFDLVLMRKAIVSKLN